MEEQMVITTVRLFHLIFATTLRGRYLLSFYWKENRLREIGSFAKNTQLVEHHRTTVFCLYLSICWLINSWIVNKIKNTTGFLDCSRFDSLAYHTAGSWSCSGGYQESPPRVAPHTECVGYTKLLLCCQPLQSPLVPTTFRHHLPGLLLPFASPPVRSRCWERHCV